MHTRRWWRGQSAGANICRGSNELKPGAVVLIAALDVEHEVGLRAVGANEKLQRNGVRDADHVEEVGQRIGTARLANEGEQVFSGYAAS